MAITACGLNHKTAPVSVREKVVFAQESIAEPLCYLLEQPLISEAAILSTCNRTEIYTDAQDSDFIIDWLASHHQIATSQLKPHLYFHQDIDALRHMMRVACGLDSMMLGEPQILGQLKGAYHHACKHGTIGRQFRDLFNHIFSATKRIRSETNIGVNPMTIAYAAVNLAKYIFSDLSQLSVLMIAAGETAELTTRYLQQQGVKQFIVANRTLANAEVLADSLGGQAILIGQIPEVLANVDIVISATASQLPILGKGIVERTLKVRKHRPMFLLDLAVPRDIEVEVGDLADVFLYNVDDLQHIIEDGMNDRRDAALQAEHLIELELDKFIRWQRSLNATDTICAYRNKMQTLADTELQRSLGALQKGESAPQVITELTHRIIKKMMHQPTLKLRKAGYDGREDIQTLARYLFELDD